MADDLIVKGKKYISAKQAAEIGGYERDYIGQLCRAGKITGSFVGRNWFVYEKSLLKHKKDVALLALKREREREREVLSQRFFHFSPKNQLLKKLPKFHFPPFLQNICLGA